MKRIFFPFLLLTLLFAVTTVFPQKAVDPSPYNAGENLVYEGKYKPFLGIPFTVADLEFNVMNSADSDDVNIKMEARSRGTLIKLFGFKFYQRIESTVDSQMLQAKKTVKRDEQGNDRIRDSEANFDYEIMKVSYTETDPNDPSRPPRRVASVIDFGTQDIVTAIYMLRTLPFEVGKTLMLRVSDSGLVYDVPVNVLEREQKDSILGKVWCWKVEPQIFGDGRFIEQKGSLTIWITDDARRMPVRANLDTKLGDVDIKLKEIRNTQIREESSK
ncbi:MAG: DUF3108 domain-containing protein [Pyrinomonadaceae bacterium]